MKKFFLYTLGGFILTVMACNCTAQTKQEKEIPVAKEQSSASKQNYKIENGMIIPINNRPMIVDFSASWCPPCRQLKPIFEELAKEYNGKIDFVTIDVDQNQQLSAQYNVQNIPCLLYINPQGQVLSRTIGFHTKDELKADISQQFNL